MSAQQQRSQPPVPPSPSTPPTATTTTDDNGAQQVTSFAQVAQELQEIKARLDAIEKNNPDPAWADCECCECGSRKGLRYHCDVCVGCDLCQECYKADKKHADHVFVVLKARVKTARSHKERYGDKRRSWNYEGPTSAVAMAAPHQADS